MNKDDLYQTDSARIQGFAPLPKTRPHTRITVAQHKEFGGNKWEPATVNFPSIGSQESGDVIAFANTLLVAAELAQEWTKNPPKATHAQH